MQLIKLYSVRLQINDLCHDLYRNEHNEHNNPRSDWYFIIEELFTVTRKLYTYHDRSWHATS